MASVFGAFKLTDNEELLQKAHPEIFYKLKPRIDQYFLMKYLYNDGSKFTVWF